ncbi:TetR/AcrR family transcriptional regulator [Hoyosella subflava]|uniref:Transcriptional regulator, TetR family n=1 Tax=Hoyosella subflava (strain DSM 45089 / JCM 17490 / NBRC 109087 / DQS3-9A1) TaxID=443218 RepID=F6ELR6_HOYSD|nr:TetR/AcrR family transcriptional regulator [Hoyosella subflava]AEF41514.1 Transcriptional regulator, TetR family [Hoyosella subflava DQS3-9A1]
MSERSRGRLGKAERAPLSRERIVTAAIALADEKGETGVTMRAVAARLSVEAMSLYNHVTGRENLLDGMVDAVFSEIELPAAGSDWKTAMRERAHSSRAALLRHPWAVGLMDSRSQPGPETLRHHDAVLGALLGGGFAIEMAGRAISVIDSYIYGFALQELSLPFTSAAELDEVAGDILRDLPDDTYPHLTAIIADRASGQGYDTDDEFEFGLSLILDALPPTPPESSGAGQHNPGKLGR